MKDWDTIVQKAADEDFAYLRSLRREFHRHPEIGQEEFWTAARIEEELDRLELPHQRLGGTGLLAWLEGTAGTSPCQTPLGKDRCLALRADIDALPITEMRPSPYQSENPGCMHACGHDVHLTSLIGAARVLTRCREAFAGRILLVFQPGEENGYGGKLMVDEGAVEGATRCFGFHIAPELRQGTLALVPGPNNASVDWFRIRIQGSGSHVAYPHQGADALYSAAQIVVAAQSLVTRLSNPQEPLLIGFGRLDAGVAYNIVAEKAELEGTIRSLNPLTRSQIKEKLE
ncbi:MAG: amidohydrolase, partial [Lachnospiraceae bacterium]|nr:amidohydrolase [Lachnospiraceae bacterium]